MDYRIGDRVKWIYTYEVVDFPASGEVSLMCMGLDNGKGVMIDRTKIGAVYIQFLSNLKTSTYLGNFAKSQNFNNLYSILNDGI